MHHHRGWPAPKPSPSPGSTRRPLQSPGPTGPPSPTAIGRVPPIYSLFRAYIFVAICIHLVLHSIFACTRTVHRVVFLRNASALRLAHAPYKASALALYVLPSVHTIHVVAILLGLFCFLFFCFIFCWLAELLRVSDDSKRRDRHFSNLARFFLS